MYQVPDESQSIFFSLAWGNVGGWRLGIGMLLNNEAVSMVDGEQNGLQRKENRISIVCV